MILADTSVWVEFLRVNKKIFPVLKALLENGEILAMECVFAELLQGAWSKRESDIIMNYWRYLPKEDERGIWIQAGIYSGENSLVKKGIGVIDSAIICFARNYNARIWSLDIKLVSTLAANEIFSPSLKLK